MAFVISVVLVRLLTPSDFGTIALLSVYMGLAWLFVNAGFASVLIQKQDATHTDESTVFWFNVAAGLIFAVVLVVTSPYIAGFFSLPILIPLTMLMAITVVLSALSSIHSTLFTKQLNFKIPMKISAIEALVSGGVGVGMAWSGYGVWSLAGQALASGIVSTSLFWYFSTWRPAFVFSRDSFKRLFSISGYYFATGLLNTLYDRGYTMLIGKFYSTSDLGLYSRANSTQQIPVDVVGGILSRVLFPLLSSVNHDRERMRNGVRMATRSIMLVAIPAMAGLCVLAELFVRTVYGDQWLPMVHILQILCFSGVFFPLHVINISLLSAQGQAKLLLHLTVIKRLVGITLLIVGSFFGLIGIAWAVVTQNLFTLILNTKYTKKEIDYGIYEQIHDCMPATVQSALMCLIVVWCDSVINITGVFKLPLLVIIGAIFYFLSNFIFGISAFKDLIKFIKHPE